MIGPTSLRHAPAATPNVVLDETPAPATHSEANPEQAHHSSASETSDQWHALTREQRIASARWRRTLRGVQTSPRIGHDADPHYAHERRSRALTQAWIDATRELCRRSSPVRPSDPQQAAAFDSVLEQLTSLVDESEAKASAYQTSRLVAVAQRVDEIDAWIETHGIDAMPRKMLEQRNVVTAALVDHDVYFDQSIPQILPARVQRIDAHDDNGPGGSGFFGAVYADPVSGNILAANRGTEMNIAARAYVDWKQNVLQALGLPSRQYEAAIAWGKTLTQLYPASRLMFTGALVGRWPRFGADLRGGAIARPDIRRRRTARAHGGPASRDTGVLARGRLSRAGRSALAGSKRGAHRHGNRRAHSPDRHDGGMAGTAVDAASGRHTHRTAARGAVGFARDATGVFPGHQQPRRIDRASFDAADDSVAIRTSGTSGTSAFDGIGKP